ncbi:MAG: ANTAR domain-containing protein [Oscillospiraceae bacterium]|nr:ANTAR domain-containing protein [Oscillospiraceae bacterium]
MEQVLIASASDKGVKFFTDFFPDVNVDIFDSAERAAPRAENCSLFIVDAPLTDEFGTSFAVMCAKIGSTVLVVKKERYEQIAQLVEPHGVIVIAKPLNAQTFKYILKTLEITRQRISELETKIEDIRLIDRAKLVLISNLKMTEPQAHRHIERQAMDRRVTKRDIAMGILKTYEEPKPAGIRLEEERVK